MHAHESNLALRQRPARPHCWGNLYPPARAAFPTMPACLEAMLLLLDQAILRGENVRTLRAWAVTRHASWTRGADEHSPQFGGCVLTNACDLLA